MEHPFFSIVMPTYNRAKMISKAIQSAIDQDYPDWELIVVDDGSTDKTKETVSAFNDKRIRYIYQENQERSIARNNGIKSAIGKYICFLDSDDYYLPRHLSSFYKTIEENKFPKAVFFCNTLIEHDGELKKFQEPVFTGKNNVENILTNTLRVQRACVERSIFEEFKFNPEIRIGEDTELWVRVAQKYPIILSGDYTDVYVNHEGMSVAMHDEKSQLSNIETLKFIYSNLKNYPISKAIERKALSQAYFKLAKHYLYCNKKINFIKALFASFIIQPSHKWKEKLYIISRFTLGKQ